MCKIKRGSDDKPVSTGIKPVPNIYSAFTGRKKTNGAIKTLLVYFIAVPTGNVCGPRKII